MFHVGQQVVCVDDSRWVYDPTRVPFPLRRGCIYTVAGIEVDDEGCFLFLEEVPPCKTHDGSFRSSRFRPVRKTSIDIFTAMLAPTPKERVGA